MGLADAIRPLWSRTSLRRAAVAVAVAVPMLVVAPAAALAAPAAPGAAAPAVVPGAAVAEGATAAPRPTAGGPHCALAAGEGAVLRCFGTFPAAVAYATGGRVTGAPASPADAVRDPAFTAAVEAAATTAATVLVGIEYADLNYGGASLSMYAPGRCDDSADVDYRFASLPAGWNDRISSFRSYSNCAQQLFNSTNFGTALTGIVGSSSYVGATANDKASSVTFN
jgi:hypothetical protein